MGRTGRGWLIGLLTAAVAVGVGEFVAVFVRPTSSPVIAVGNRVITLTPESVKRQAIGSVGTDDKTLLILGTLVLLAVIGAFVGELALRSVRVGIAGVAVIGAFACYCAVSQPAGRASDLVPSVVGTLVAAAVLYRLVPLASADAGPAAGTARRPFLVGSVAAAVLAAVTGFGGRALLDSRYSVAGERAKVALPQATSGEAAVVPAGATLGGADTAWRTQNGDFYRIDRALVVPQIDPDTWTLRIHGLVDKPMFLTYRELLRRPLVDRWITLNCVSNDVGGDLVGNTQWRGVLLADVLREAGIRDSCDQLFMTGADAMTIGAPTRTVMDGRSALLAVGMNGSPLPLEHGFPVRVVVPGLYGYISACKWITDLEATTYADHEVPYWVGGGWAADPPLQLASRIDNPVSDQDVQVGQTVSVGGVAWDQHVGVSRVEVQVDGGAWQTARLGTVPSADTWREWVWDWTPASAGNHTLTVRAVNAAGMVQTARQRDVYPSGATGLHRITVTAQG